MSNWARITAILLAVVLITVTLLPIDVSTTSDGILSISLRQASANPDWLSGYDYRKEITIDGSSAGAQTDYQKRLIVHKDNAGTPIAENGMSQPLYSTINYPQAYYYNGKTYVAWQAGASLDPYIDCYTHSTGTWHGVVKIGTNPLSGDDHGSPVVIVDNSGYIHVFYGSHISALEYAKSTSTEDISAWTAQTDIGSTCTYPNLIKVSDGTLYMFVRERPGTDFEDYFRTSSDWTSTTKIIEVADTADSIYHGNAEYDSTNGRIHLAWTYNDDSAGTRVNIYHAYLYVGTSNGQTKHNLYAMDDTDLGTSITKAEADASCLVVNSGAYESNHPSLHLDSSGYPSIIYNIDSATVWHHNLIQWNGSSWDSAVEITASGGQHSYTDFIVTASNDIDAYLVVVDVTCGGDIEKWHWNGSAWSKTSTILAKTDAEYDGLSSPNVVVNGVSGLRCVFCDIDLLVFTHSDLEIFAIDSSDNFVDGYGYQDTGGHCLDNFADLRFTQADGSTKVDYWISPESVVSGDLCKAWIEFNSIADGGGAPSYTNCYMYYGDADAVSESSGADTFIFFDDFERGNDGDEIGGGWTEVAGTVEISTTHAFGGTRSMKLEGVTGTRPAVNRLDIADSENQEIRFRVFKEDASELYVYHADASHSIQIRIDASEDINYYDGSYHDTGADCAVDAWELLAFNDFDWTGTTYDIILNGVSISDDTPMRSLADNEHLLQFQGEDTNGVDTWIDDIIIRNWCDPEPTWGAWGDEESYTIEITNTPSSNDFGVLAVSTTGNTAINYFTIENTGNTAVDVVIYGTDLSGGDDTWDLADTGTPGENIYGLYAGLDDADDLFDVIVRETVTYNTLLTNLAESATQGWGLKIYMPTSVTNYDAQQMSGTITLVASAT